jgi:hypothetical protein
LAFVSLFAAACYTPAPANGVWACSVGTHACPSGYYCAADDTCWKNTTRDGGTGGDGGTACAGSTAPLCEDFESGSIDATIWSMNTMSGGQLSVDGQHAHRGSFALHSHTDFIANESLVVAQITVMQKLFPMLQGGFYTRVFVYLSSPAPAASDALLYAARPSGNGDTLGLGPGSDGVELWDIDENKGEFSSTSMPLGTWVCFEWSLNGDSSRAWINGNEVSDIDYTGSAKGSYQSLSFGTDLFEPSNQAPTDLWIDDIIVDTSQIGCSR